MSENKNEPKKPNERNKLTHLWGLLRLSVGWNASARAARWTAKV